MPTHVTSHLLPAVLLAFKWELPSLARQRQLKPLILCACYPGLLGTLILDMLLVLPCPDFLLREDPVRRESQAGPLPPCHSSGDATWSCVTRDLLFKQGRAVRYLRTFFLSNTMSILLLGSSSTCICDRLHKPPLLSTFQSLRCLPSISGHPLLLPYLLFGVNLYIL
jgi:hypothetical protein